MRFSERTAAFPKLLCATPSARSDSRSVVSWYCRAIRLSLPRTYRAPRYLKALHSLGFRLSGGPRGDVRGANSSAAWQHCDPDFALAQRTTGPLGHGTPSTAAKRDDDGMDWKLELITVPVSDVDRAKEFYTEQVGFDADHDHTVSDDLRFVQLTPPGSACSIAIGK